MDKRIALNFKLYYFLKFIGHGVYYPFLVMLLANRGIGGSELGILLMVVPIGKVFLQPVSGYLCDLYRIHKQVLLFSLIANSIGGLVMYLCQPVFSCYLLAIIIISLGEINMDMLINTLTIDYLSRTNDQTKFGRWRLWGSFGFMGGSFLLGLFALDQTLPLIPVIFALANFSAFFTALTLPKASAKKPLDWLGGIKILTHNPSFALLLAGMVFSGITFSIIMNYYSVYMNMIGAASWMIGLGVAMQTGIEIILSASTKTITEKFSIRFVYLLGFAVVPIRSFLYYANQNPVLGLVIQNLHGFFFFGTFIVGMLVLDLNLKPEWRSTGQAYYYAAFGGIGAIVGSFIAPLIFEQLGISALWMITAGIAFVGFILILQATKKLSMSKEADETGNLRNPYQG